MKFKNFILYIINNDGEHFLFPFGATSIQQAKTTAIRKLNDGGYGPVRDNDEQVRLIPVEEMYKLSSIEDMKPGRLQVYKVLTEKCAVDLNSEVGEQLVIVDENFENPTDVNTKIELLYWTGDQFNRTYAESFIYWIEKKGLRLISV